jgi:hypothetical protein
VSPANDWTANEAAMTIAANKLIGFRIGFPLSIFNPETAPNPRWVRCERIGQFVNCLGMIYATYFIWAKHFG